MISPMSFSIMNLAAAQAVPAAGRTLHKVYWTSAFGLDVLGTLPATETPHEGWELLGYVYLKDEK